MRQQMVIVVVTLLCLLLTIPERCAGFKIFRGKDSDPRPWAAWLKRGKNRLLCGGSLISPSWVLTAAHCVTDQVTGVVVGDHDLAIDDGSEQEIPITEMIAHPGYDRRTHANDIALIRLASVVNISDTVNPVPLVPANASEEDRLLDKHCRIVGWGFSDIPDGPMYCDQSLTELTIDHLTDSDCEGQGHGRPETAICISSYTRQLSGLCPGDIGSPVVCRERQLWTQVALVSAWNVTEECSAGIYGATSVSMFRTWIQTHIDST